MPAMDDGVDTVGFEEIQRARREGDLSVLNRLSLQRLHECARGRTLALFPVSPDDDARLRFELGSRGAGYVQLLGRSAGLAQRFFAALGLSRRHAMRVAVKYNPEVLVFVEHEGDAVALTADAETKLGKFDPERISAAYTETRGERVLFEWRPNSWSEAIAEQSYDRENERVLRGLRETLVALLLARADVRANEGA